MSQSVRYTVRDFSCFIKWALLVVQLSYSVKFRVISQIKFLFNTQNLKAHDTLRTQFKSLVYRKKKFLRREIPSKRNFFREKFLWREISSKRNFLEEKFLRREISSKRNFFGEKFLLTKKDSIQTETSLSFLLSQYKLFTLVRSMNIASEKISSKRNFFEEKFLRREISSDKENL